MNEDKLYFRQLLAGRDFAQDNPIAQQMVNFVYLVGDRESRQCVAIDPAWGIRDLLELVEADDMELTGALATHYHPDHVGGDLMGAAQVEGIKELLEQQGVAIHCQRDEIEWITRATEVSKTDLTGHDSGDVIAVGDIEIRLIHTPGHTPGSQCFLVENRLLAGDTLFLEGCGATHFPGGDADEIWKSLHQRLAHLPDDTVLYPGHLYGPAGSAPLGQTRQNNYVFRIRSLDDWQQFHRTGIIPS